MITLEQLEEACGENKKPYKNNNIDHKSELIKLLRERIPFEECPRLIGAAEHDIVYLCDIELAARHLNEEDLVIIEECNTGFDDELGCLFFFT